MFRFFHCFAVRNLSYAFTLVCERWTPPTPLHR